MATFNKHVADGATGPWLGHGRGSTGTVQSAHNGGLLPGCKETPHIDVIIAVGANLPGAGGETPRQTCERAVRSMADLPGISALVRSRWYSSAPVPPSGQPRYVNGAVRACCALSPACLLEALQRIEQAAGRARTVADAARTLDLDIIDIAGLVRRAPDPVLPHPRSHLRRFVLLPLRDVAPRWVHPVAGVGVSALLDGLRSEDVHAL